jgi:hypothetical protein
MNDTPSPFAPFQPNPAAQPTHSPIPPEQTKTKKELAAEKKAAKAAAKAPPAAEPAAPRQPRKPSLKSHAPKFDLQTTLAAAQMLNDDDFGLFERIVILFDEAGKPQRDRVLAAVAKVFG